jgi:hypothetical protein
LNSHSILNNGLLRKTFNTAREDDTARKKEGISKRIYERRETDEGCVPHEVFFTDNCCLPIELHECPQRTIETIEAR